LTTGFKGIADDPPKMRFPFAGKRYLYFNNLNYAGIVNTFIWSILFQPLMISRHNIPIQVPYGEQLTLIARRSMFCNNSGNRVASFERCFNILLTLENGR